jgi:cysteine-rich repeat protein
MVSCRVKWTALAIGAGIVGCNSLAGIRPGVYDACIEDAGNPGCTPPPPDASTGSLSATTGGAGGAPASCGNGVLEPGEECDDGNALVDDGCTQCSIDCDEPGAFKAPESAHCYWVLPKPMSFFESSVKCQYQGGYLASVTSSSELALIDSAGVNRPVWLGASALAPNGTFRWLDGEPWVFAPWSGSKPEVTGKDLCVVVTGEPLTFEANECALARKGLCERGPVVAPSPTP